MASSGAGAGAGEGGSGAGGGRSEFLKSTVKIGSKKLGLTFGPEDTVFAPNDVPQQARKARAAVRRSKRANLLGVEKPKWNQSSHLGEALCKRKTKQMTAHDRNEFTYNYRAEVLPTAAELITDNVVSQRVHSALVTTKRVQEMPVNPALAPKPTWNQSTQLTEEERKQVHESVVNGSQTNSMKKTQRLKGYSGPVNRYKDRLNKTRELRSKGLQDAGAKLVAAPETDVAPAHQPVSYTAKVSRKFKQYHHSGTYQPSRFDKGYVWSCCMAEDKDARGCLVTTVNPDAWNFVSIN